MITKTLILLSSFYLKCSNIKAGDLKDQYSRSFQREGLENIILISESLLLGGKSLKMQLKNYIGCVPFTYLRLMTTCGMRENLSHWSLLVY